MTTNPAGASLRYETTIGQSKRDNPQLSESTQLDEFVRFRNERDATLRAPRLLFESVQVNIDAGRPAPVAGQRPALPDRFP